MATDFGYTQPDPPLTPSGRVDVAQVISSEFGTQKQVVRSQLSMGTLLLDGKEYTDDKLFLPLEAVWGKTIEVIGPDRRWKMLYKN